MDIRHCRTAEELVSGLAASWSTPRSDPFAFDLAVVPSAGFGRWLSQQLAGPDGICAGVEFISPAGFERRLLGDDDPWSPQRLVWRVQRLAASGDPSLAVLADHLAACRESYTTSHRIARHFAGYSRYRRGMLQRWAAGLDEGPNGLPLAENAWQAHLWRLLVDELGENPLQRSERLLAKLRAAPVPGVAERVAVLAPAQIDAASVELWQAISAHHQVDLLMLSPADRQPLPASGEVRRAEFVSGFGHRLNRSLGQLADEAASLLPEPAPADAAAPPESGTLLGRLQADLRRDREPVPPQPVAVDGSIQVHLSHDLSRQVEVLREVITQLLSDDPSLEPRHIAVLTPDPEAVAPLISATFAAGEPTHPASGFRVSIADRSLAQANAVAAVLLRLLALPEERLEASAVLELCAQPAIARRFGFRPDDRDRLVDLVTKAGIRWGLSAAQRSRYGLAAFPQNTWFAGLQRMLLGVTLPETDLVSAGTVLPLDDVDSSDVDLVGGLTEFIGRLARVLAEFDRPATVAVWAARCREALDALVRPAPGQEWELSEVWAELAQLSDLSGGVETEVTRADIRRVLTAAFTDAPARGVFGNGSLLVAGLHSLRHVPHRVVVLLGWDAERYPRPSRRQGDDLLGDEPRVGDPSAALLDRQLLLDAVHAARQQLVVIAQCHSVSTTEAVPLAAPITDLLEALDATTTVETGSTAAAISVHHPLQPFDTGYFSDARPDLFSADPLAFRAAAASLAEPVAPRQRYALAPLQPVDLSGGVTLAELTAFFTHPASNLLKVRAGINLAPSRQTGDAIPIELDALDRWQIGNRMLSRLRAGDDPATVSRAEWLRGDVPPFALGQQVIDSVLTEAQRTLRLLPATSGEAHLHDLDVDLEVPGVGRVALVGRVGTVGDELLQVEFSSLAPKHRLVSWIRLLALTAATGRQWHARVIGKGKSVCLASPPPEVARRLLGDLLGIYRMGLSQPLPAPPRLCMEWAAMRAVGRDPLDPKSGRLRLRDRWKWETDAHWRVFFDFDSLISVPAPAEPVPGADPAEKLLLGALASSMWRPLIAAEVSA